MTKVEIERELASDAYWATSYEWFLEVSWSGLAKAPCIWSW